MRRQLLSQHYVQNCQDSCRQQHGCVEHGSLRSSSSSTLVDAVDIDVVVIVAEVIAVIMETVSIVFVMLVVDGMALKAGRFASRGPSSLRYLLSHCWRDSN